MVGPFQTEPIQPDPDPKNPRPSVSGRTLQQLQSLAVDFNPKHVWDQAPRVQTESERVRLRDLQKTLEGFQNELTTASERIKDNRALIKEQDRIRGDMAAVQQNIDRLVDVSRRGQQNILENSVEDIKLFVGGLITLYKDVVIPSAIDVAGNLGWLSEIDGEDVTDGISQSGGLMLKGLVDSVEKWENPGKAFHNHPIEALLDVTAVAAMAGKTIQWGAKGAELAGLQTRLLRPVSKIKGVTTLAETEGGLILGSLDDLARVQQKLVKFDFERVGDALIKFPFQLLGEELDKATRGARKAYPFFNDIMAFSGLSKEAREINKLAAQLKRRKTQLRRQSAVKEIFRKKLNDKESKIALFEINKIDQLLDAEPRLRTAAQAGNVGARRLVDLIPTMRETYKDIIDDARKLSPARRKEVNRAKELYLKDLKDQEQWFREAGILEPDKFRRAQVRFISQEFKEFNELKNRTRVEAGDSADEFYDAMAEFDILPDYVPISQIDRRSGIAIALETLKNRALRGSGRGTATLGRLETAEGLTLRKLFDEPDPKTGKPIFRSSLDQLAYKNATAAAEVKATVEFLDRVSRHPKARLMKGADKLRPGEVYFVPDVFKKYARGMVRTETMIRDELVKLGINEFTSDGLLRAWPKIKNQIIGAGLRDQEDLMRSLKVFAIPEDMAIAVNRNLTPASLFMQTTFDSVTDRWKMFVLLYNPGWYIQNLIGNVILTMSGGIGLFDQFRAGNYIRRNKLDAAMLLPDEMGTVVDEVAILGGRLQAQAKGGIGKTLADIAQFVDDKSWGVGITPTKLTELAQRLEKQGIPFLRIGGRDTAFVAMLRRRWKDMMKAADSGATTFKSVKDILEAAKFKPGRKATAEQVARFDKATQLVKSTVDEVNTHLFDYYNLHPFERQFFRRAFPFWPWVRNINLLVARKFKEGFDQPLKSLAYQRLSKMSMDLIDDQDLPSWLKGHMMVGTTEDGDFVFLNTRRYNPFFGLGSQAVALSSLNPFIKVLYERKAGKNAWTEREFRSSEAVILYSGRRLRLDKNTGRFTEEPFLPPLHTHLMNQFPHHYWMNQIINPFVQTDAGNVFRPEPIRDMDGNPRYPRDQLFAWGQALGVPLLKMDRNQLGDMHDRKARWNKFSVEKIKSLMKSRPPDEHDFYLNVIDDLLLDNRKFVEFKDR